MAKIINVKYEGVGYNATELSKMPLDQIKKEVAHHFKNDPKFDDKAVELFTLIKKAVPDEALSSPVAAKTVAPEQNTDKK